MSDLFTAEDHIRKIAKLLATAESYAEAGNQAAADSFVGKAHALQTKYEIDSAMIEAHNEGEIAPQKVIERTLVMPDVYGARFQDLANTVTKASGCTGYYTSRGGRYTGKKSQHQYVAFGFPADIEYVDHLFQSLVTQVDYEMKAAKRKWKAEQMRLPKYAREHGKSMGVAFLAGFTVNIGDRLRTTRRKAEQEARREEFRKVNESTHLTDSEVDDIVAGRRAHAGEVGQSVALVLADKAKRVEKEMYARHTGLISRQTNRSVNSSSGYRMGAEAAGRANLGKGVGGGNKGSLGGGGA